MPELSVVVFSTDSEQQAILQMQVDGTAVARTVASYGAFPVGASDLVVRKLHETRPSVIVLDLPAQQSGPGLLAIELLHAELPETPIFVVGDMKQPQLIVSAMRAGAREYLERPTSTTQLLEGFVRLTSSQRKTRNQQERGKVYTVINAKGGCGATTVAVNTALAMQALHGQTALVDLAPLGHAALHMNLKPSFNSADAVRNLHRMDASLLESYMTRHANGLAVLAGPREPGAADPVSAELARLFDLLVMQYRHVIVDVSSRVDAVARVVCDVSERVLLIANTDVPSLWSAARLLDFLSQAGGRDRVQLVLNRYRKIAGFDDKDAEKLVNTKVLWKIPNQYPLVSGAIDRGVPVVQANHSELARCFTGLASALTPVEEISRRRGWSLFKTA